MSETMTTCQLRLKAAEVIEQRGWYQHGFAASPDGPVCLLGALIEADAGSAYSSDIANVPIIHPRVVDACVAMGFTKLTGADIEPSDMSRPHRWNDAKDRTKDEVLARLRDGCHP